MDKLKVTEVEDDRKTYLKNFEVSDQHENTVERARREQKSS